MKKKFFSKASAKEMYSGRCTIEFLVDKVGHRHFEHLQELDLSNNRIRYEIQYTYQKNDNAKKKKKKRYCLYESMC